MLAQISSRSVLCSTRCSQARALLRGRLLPVSSHRLWRLQCLRSPRLRRPWFGISVTRCGLDSYAGPLLGLIRMIQAVFACSIFPYCSPAFRELACRSQVFEPPEAVSLSATTVVHCDSFTIGCIRVSTSAFNIRACSGTKCSLPCPISTHSV